MPTRTVTNQQLTPDATYFVRGKIGFCRVTRLTTDDERERANQSRVHPITRNYTTVTLYEAQVLVTDPNNPTVEEIYAAESMYKNKNPQERPGLNFSAINKSSRLPRVGVLSPTPTNPQNYKEIRPTAELAVGLDVTLVMRVFKGQGNNGVSLDRVLVNEPIRYFGGSDQVDRAMSQRGITFESLPPENLAAGDPGAEPDPPAEDPEVDTSSAFAPPAQAQAPAAAPAPNAGMPAPSAAPAGAFAPAASGDNPFTAPRQY